MSPRMASFRPRGKSLAGEARRWELYIANKSSHRLGNKSNRRHSPCIGPCRETLSSQRSRAPIDPPARYEGRRVNADTHTWRSVQRRAPATIPARVLQAVSWRRGLQLRARDNLHKQNRAPPAAGRRCQGRGDSRRAPPRLAPNPTAPGAVGAGRAVRAVCGWSGLHTRCRWDHGTMMVAVAG